MGDVGEPAFPFGAFAAGEARMADADHASRYSGSKCISGRGMDRTGLRIGIVLKTVSAGKRTSRGMDDLEASIH